MSQASKPHTTSTPAISRHAGQAKKLVLPSMNDCIACMMSGTNNKIKELTAPSTTPTTTPANSKRKVCCTPCANSSVKSTASKAPTKAAPESPSSASHCVASGDTPHQAMARATPSDAPDALPNR